MSLMMTQVVLLHRSRAHLLSRLSDAEEVFQSAADPLARSTCRHFKGGNSIGKIFLGTLLIAQEL